MRSYKEIVIRSLRKEYSDADRRLLIIEDLSYRISLQRSLAIIGRSGVGKSTLLHLLSGLDRPTAGSVFFDDLDIFSLRGRELANFRSQTLGFIFQAHNLLLDFSALENVALPLIVGGLRRAKAILKAEELLVQVGLADRLNHLPSRLSGGEQQRVAIARALVNMPAVVFADEPTGSLDPKTAVEVAEILLNSVKSRGAMLLAVTHNKEFAKMLDDTLEMRAGGFLQGCP
ncbi:MAG TPA: ABC transporter ATP-binding protein [Oligoflexia bacterium]|nr:ABC transporter ATP-binding protein [Oligoflexia bacterium]HMP27121.1 ABC transporter ATP-binding protein [Oligoflexia bacterium]